MRTIGERLKASRLKAKISLTEAGKITGVSRQTLYKYENGVITNIPSDKIEALASAYDVTPAYIMGWTDDINDGYYTNKEVAKYAEELRNNSDMRLLFDVAQDISKDDLNLVVNIIKDLKKRSK